MEETRLSKRRGVDPRYYLTNEGTGQSSLWKCKKSVPTTPDDTTTVVFAKNTTGYLKVIPGTENTTMLTSLPTTFDQKGWLVDGPLNGTFANGTWTFHLKIITGKDVPGNITVHARLWKSSNSDGSNAIAVTDWLTLDTISSPASSTEYQVTANVSLSEISLSDEYLFVEFALGTTSACGKAGGCTVTFRCNEGPSTTAIDATEFSSTETGWLSGWQYRKSHEIEGSTAGAQTDYQVKIIVHKGTGTDSGEHVYCNNHCRDDFGDIRFTKSDGTTELYYWLEDYTSGDKATFWVKIPSIPASPDTVTIYIYYGKSDATTTSDGKNTFIFFDDFEGSSLDTSKWTWQDTGSGGSYTISNSELDVDNTTDGTKAGVYSTAITKSKCIITVKAKGVRDGGSNAVQAPSIKINDNATIGAPSSYANQLFFSGYDAIRHARFTGFWSTTDMYATSQPTTYKLWQFVKDGSSWTAKYMNLDYSVIASHTATVADYTFYIALHVQDNSEAKYDWVYIRNYVDPEPSHGSWGSEETAAETVTFNIDTVISQLQSAHVVFDTLINLKKAERAQLTATLESNGSPLEGKTIKFYVYQDGSWQLIGTDTTNADGQATVTYDPPVSGTYQFKAVFEGDSSYGSSEDTASTDLAFIWGVPLHTDTLLQTAAKTLTFDVDTLLSTVATTTYTSDVLLSTIHTRSLQLDVIVKSIHLVEVDVDAVLQLTTSVSVPADVLLAATYTSSFTSNVLLSTVYTVTFTIDTLLATYETVAYSIDVLISLTNTVQYHVDVLVSTTRTSAWQLDVLLKTPYLASFDADLLVSRFVRETFGVDTLLLQIAPVTLPSDVIVVLIGSLDVPVDVLIKTTRASTFQIDVLLGVPTIVEFHVDALIKGVFLVTYTVDVLIATSYTLTFQADVIIGGLAGVTLTIDTLLSTITAATVTLDVLVAIVRSTEFNIDTLLAQVATETFDTDTILTGHLICTLPMDVLLLVTSTVTVPLDALLSTTYVTTLATDALLSKLSKRSIVADMILFGRYLRSISVEMYLAKTFSTILSADVMIGSFLVAQIATDVLIATSYTRSISLTVLVSTTHIVQFAADSMVSIAKLCNVPTDILLQTTHTISYPVNALLATTYSRGFVTDVLLATLLTVQFTSDVIVIHRFVVSLLTDTLFSTVRSASFTISVIVGVTTLAEVALDVLLTTTYTKTFTADVLTSVLKKQFVYVSVLLSTTYQAQLLVDTLVQATYAVTLPIDVELKQIVFIVQLLLKADMLVLGRLQAPFDVDVILTVEYISPLKGKLREETYGAVLSKQG